MFTFYSKKKLQHAVETGIKKIDDALAIEDMRQRAKALLAAQEETLNSYTDLGTSVAKNASLSIVGSLALAVTGAFIMFSTLPAALVTAAVWAVPFFCVTGLTSILKSMIDDSVIGEKINPLREKVAREKIAAEISAIFTHDHEGFMKTPVEKQLTEKLQKYLAEEFDKVGSKKNNVNEEYAQLKQKIGNPVPKA